jgi:hypothetical protein
MIQCIVVFYITFVILCRQVFKVERHGEGKRYKNWTKLPNRKLLWHGSRLTNYAGILSQVSAPFFFLDNK